MTLTTRIETEGYLLDGLCVNWFSDTTHACQYTIHVSVHNPLYLAKGNGGNGRCGVRANARQLAQQPLESLRASTKVLVGGGGKKKKKKKVMKERKQHKQAVQVYPQELASGISPPRDVITYFAPAVEQTRVKPMSTVVNCAKAFFSAGWAWFWCRL